MWTGLQFHGTLIQIHWLAAAHTLLSATITITMPSRIEEMTINTKANIEMNKRMNEMSGEKKREKKCTQNERYRRQSGKRKVNEKPTNVNSMCNGKVLEKPQNRQLKNLWWEILRMQNIRIDYSGQITFKMKRHWNGWTYGVETIEAHTFCRCARVCSRTHPSRPMPVQPTIC